MIAEAQTDDKPKMGRWFCLEPHVPPPIYCRICKKSNDHMTKQCPRFGSKVHEILVVVFSAVPNYCEICGKLYEHRTEDCPQKQGMEMVGDQAAFVGV